MSRATVGIMPSILFCYCVSRSTLRRVPKKVFFYFGFVIYAFGYCTADSDLLIPPLRFLKFTNGTVSDGGGRIICFESLFFSFGGFNCFNFLANIRLL